MTDAGMLIANPALGDNPMLARNYTNGAYQGTVIWSWQMSMMAKGLENQLGRCQAGGDMPQFCNDAVVFGNVKKAYNVLWDNIDANKDQLDQEVWSWVFRNGKFEATPLGTLPPPPGVASQTGKLSLIRRVMQLMVVVKYRIRHHPAVVVDVFGCHEEQSFSVDRLYSSQRRFIYGYPGSHSPIE